MARPEYQPTEKDRSTVQTMAAYGIPQPDIAAVVGCDSKTLRKHFRQELDTAATQANARVAASLFKKATGDGSSSVAAAIFWLKARADWREKQEVDHKSSDGSMTPKPTTIRIVAADDGSDDTATA